MNLAFMAKMGWRFLCEKDKLWVRVLETRYKSNDIFNPENIISTRHTSKIWQDIIKATPILSQGIMKMVNNGEGTKFWKDKWLTKEPYP